MKTKIAIFTKAEYSKEMNYIVASLKADDRFDVFEVEDGKNIPSDCNNLIVFGGDGTVLEAVKNVREDVVVTGVNIGNLGFLTQFEKDSSASEITNGIIEGKIEQRATLDVRFDGFCDKALNEIVLKSATSRPIYIGVYVDGKFVDSYHSDGAIVSSPTGSTAYSLSAGGPVLAPDVDALVIIPVCAHSLHSRPLVVNAQSKIELRLAKGEKAIVCADGENVANIEGEKSVFVEKSARNVKFLATKDNNFFKKLLQKMNRWGLVDPRG